MHREEYPKLALLAELADAAASRAASFFWVQIPGEAPVVSSAISKLEVSGEIDEHYISSLPSHQSWTNKDVFEMPFSEGAWFRVKTYLPRLEL